MDDSILIDRLRADADRLDDLDVDIDALVRGAVTHGRRRRGRRRIAGAVTGVVAAGVAVAAIATSVPALRAAQEVDPVAPPPSAATTEPTPSQTPSPTGRVSGSPKQVQATVTDLLPSSLTVAQASSARDVGSNGFAWENSAALTVTDAKGTSYLNVAIGNGGYVDGCLGLPDCEQTTLPDGGTLWITRSPSGDKAGADRTFTYDRPDGSHLFMMERTYAEGNGPVTRDTVPLSDAEGRALVTSTAWDALFRG